jgi:hypothetical protein
MTMKLPISVILIAVEFAVHCEIISVLKAGQLIVLADRIGPVPGHRAAEVCPENTSLEHNSVGSGILFTAIIGSVPTTRSLAF